MRNPKFKYSEVFGNTIEGEGKHTSQNRKFVRLFGCNLTCDGFGQKDPTNPDSWVLPYKDLDISKYKDVTELPVFEYGCDSSYSWAKDYSCLAKKGTASEIVDEIESVGPSKSFQHPVSKQWTSLSFTGGEPMISQTVITAILDELKARNNLPKLVNVETNGTQKLRANLKEVILRDYLPSGPYDRLTVYPEFYWSVSPKLFLSGAPWDQTIKPEIVGEYYEVSPFGQLKYVCDGSNRAWDEVEEATRLFREQGVTWDVWIMPVGATKEGQEEIQAEVAEEALKRGYNVAARVHCFLFGNKVGK